MIKSTPFISLLGSDDRLLTEGESIESHELFSRLTSKKTITGEDEEEESELKYLQVIRDIRDNDPDLFAKIKRLPNKARTGRINQRKENSLLSYFRKGKLQKFFLSGGGEPKELDFFSAANLFEVSENTARKNQGKDFYEMLEKNKQAFIFATLDDMPEIKTKGGRYSAMQILKILKAIKDFRQFTEDQEIYLKRVIKELEEGGLPKQTTKKTLQEINKEMKNNINPLKILGILQKNIPQELLQEHYAESAAQTSGPREVILSEYLVKSK